METTSDWNKCACLKRPIAGLMRCENRYVKFHLLSIFTSWHYQLAIEGFRLYARLTLCHANAK